MDFTRKHCFQSHLSHRFASFHLPSLRRAGFEPKIVYQLQYFPKQLSRNSYFRHPERDIPTAANNFRPDLHQLFSQSRQQPMFHTFRQSESAHEVPKVVSQGMELKTNGVVLECPA